MWMKFNFTLLVKNYKHIILMSSKQTHNQSINQAQASFILFLRQAGFKNVFVMFK